ncbi:MAG: hypothetical protein MI975_18655 [Cytophagales bacterium]|nr:hypothetical protein [Cytophagales bacterium]
MRRKNLIFSLIILFQLCFTPIFSQTKKTLKLYKKASKHLREWKNPHSGWNHIGTIKIDTFFINSDEKKLEFQFGKPLSYLPVREENHQQTIKSLEECLGKKFRDFEITVKTNGQPLKSLIPNIYRKSMNVDRERIRTSSENRIPVVRNLSRDIPKYGLYNKNIALWHSHGWYYEAKLDRWEWQRARLYGTVEDLFPMTFVLPYLVPMLENAGANVFLPRERDTQVHEVIVDNDGSIRNSEIVLNGIMPDTINSPGFKTKNVLFAGENPFHLGGHFKFDSAIGEHQYVDYIPDIPEDGAYAVYISYIQSSENATDARYSVFHAGGKTDFLVNQQIGGSTWIYLGTFRFAKGKNAKQGSVRQSLQCESGGSITADAVKFGGGMGNIARRPANEILPNQWSLKKDQKETELSSETANPDQFQWKTSNRPRYQEGARYYLQYAGFPDTLVYSLNKGKNDYNDDYQSRGEWVNYLMGAPNGPNINRNAGGLKIPIDLSLAFHTDAGVTPRDSIIGTLGIYSSERDEGKFPNGQSKEVNRELTDIIQTEIVRDIRALFMPDWSRRGLWNKEYSEAWRPNVPAVLLELLSHQNLTDMGFGLDPRFKFAVSRAIYKGIAKFLAFQNGVDYVIQPLPVDHFSMKKIDDKTIELSWQPVPDSLEPSAVPAKYKLYRRTGKGGFDNGLVVNDTSVKISLDEFGKIYSFKVAAVNEGGESFPSEILSVGLLENEKLPILVVNGFDRVSAPAMIDQGDFGGISYWDDEGVPDKYNIGYVGQQYDFDRKSVWLDDDSPGWGASHGDMEDKLIPGNSFDNTYIHGLAIMEAGYSFISTSDEALSDPGFETEIFNTIDLIYGEEKTTETLNGDLFKVFDVPMRHKIKAFTDAGGNVFVSGAYIGSDHITNKDSVVMKFANEVLHFKWRTNHAARKGEVCASDYSNKAFTGKLEFNTAYHPEIYKVEAPDAVEPAGNGAVTAFRYSENNVSAGIMFSGKYKTVVLGFPFETILEETERNRLMKQVLDYLE